MPPLTGSVGPAAPGVQVGLIGDSSGATNPHHPTLLNPTCRRQRRLVVERLREWGGRAVTAHPYRKGRCPGDSRRVTPLACTH